MKRRPFARRAALLGLSLCLTAGLLAPVTASAAADSSVSGRTDFSWGVNGHHRGYAAYPESQLEKQIHLAAELGVKLYRFNCNPASINELAYLDKVVGLVQAYGMDMMLVMDGTDGTDEVLKSRFQMVASRYDGKSGFGRIKYIQVFNEVDVKLIKEIYPNGVGAGDGSTAKDYSASSLKTWQKKFQAAIDGVKAGCTDTKTVINISYKHTYMLEYFKENGLKWDITGLDWYADMGDIQGILDTLLSKFSQDIIICETNVWPVEGGDYDTNTAYLTNLMKQVYRYNNRIKGMIFYELLDELSFENTKEPFNGEAHFGLVYCDKNGKPGGVKPVYTAIQKLLGGGSLPIKRTSAAQGGEDPTAPPATTATKGATAPKTKAPTSGTTAGTTAETTADTAAESTVSTGGQPTATTAEPAGPSDPDGKTPVWPFIVIPAAVLAAGAGVFLLLKFRFGLFSGK